MIHQINRKILNSTIILICTFIIIHFSYYISQIQTKIDDINIFDEIDAIIVLTGDKNRIAHGINILKNGSGQRLLISGVNEKISNTKIKDLYGVDVNSKKLFDCCIDIDRISTNTFENSRETYIWSKELGFRNLLIVTSHYHVPRVKLEFSRFFSQDVLHYNSVDIINNISDISIELIRKVIFEYIKYSRTSLSLLIEI
jgi:uncharacterized SAM-binding protein YcdF (DUF218 family)